MDVKTWRLEAVDGDLSTNEAMDGNFPVPVLPRATAGLSSRKTTLDQSNTEPFRPD
jgi:hypothetical protein